MVYRPGRYRVICDISGQEVWDDEVRVQWDGAVVRNKSWSPRHPQELIRVRPEAPPPKMLRPPPPDKFVQNFAEFGFDDGMHFNFAPGLSDDLNYTKTSTSASVRGQAEAFWTRTGDAKYYRNDSGLLALAAANSIARDHDPSGYLGWLIEPVAKTNRGLRSEELDNVGVWTRIGLTTITPGAVTAPFVVATTACKIVEAAAGAGNIEHFARQTVTGITAGATVVASFLVKAAERKVAFLRVLDNGSVSDGGFAMFDLANGVVVPTGTAAIGAATLLSAYMERLANGWFRIYLRIKPNGTMTAAICDLFLKNNTAGGTSYIGDGASGLFATGFMLEEGLCGSSYIRTTNAAVARASDRVSRTLGSEFDQTKGTIYARYRLGIGNRGSNQLVINISDNSANNVIALLSGNTGLATGSVNKSGGALGSSVVAGAIADRTVVRHMLAYAENDTQAARDGTLGSGPSGPVPSALTRIDLGTDHNGAAANSCETLWLQEFHYWPRRDVNADVVYRSRFL